MTTQSHDLDLSISEKLQNIDATYPDIALTVLSRRFVDSPDAIKNALIGHTYEGELRDPTKRRCFIPST